MTASPGYDRVAREGGRQELHGALGLQTELTVRWHRAGRRVPRRETALVPDACLHPVTGWEVRHMTNWPTYRPTKQSIQTARPRNKAWRERAPGGTRSGVGGTRGNRPGGGRGGPAGVTANLAQEGQNLRLRNRKEAGLA